MNKLIKTIDPKLMKKISSRLLRAGYHKDVHLDEAQAYLATGLCTELDVPVIENIQEPFEKAFLKYKEQLKL